MPIREEVKNKVNSHNDKLLKENDNIRKEIESRNNIDSKNLSLDQNFQNLVDSVLQNTI